ncbi:outer membrane efflux protein [Akkermansia glycaniphila]|uniref:Outer membrane efflux protein n=1 Tax=Akkermansia glycaniphila TaxID=1679444 RepID=A0A1H6LQ30_9BACT|nr:outer membrane efflux protein [Akkermansia glycaniphila]
MKRYPLLLFLCLGLWGCSISRQIDERIETDSKAINELVAKMPRWEELPVRQITWQQAVDMVMKDNQEIRNLHTTIDSAERYARSIYTDLIPGVNLYSSMSQSVKELANAVTPDDISYNINILFNLPSISQLPYRVYEAQARVYAAKKNLEVKQRDLVSKLYKFIRTSELTRKADQLEREKIGLEDREWKIGALQQSREDLDRTEWAELCTLLGNQDGRWVIIPETVPNLNWDHYKKACRHLDPLSVAVLAMGLEQVRMERYQTLMQYLPQLNMNLYSPSLFSSTGGTYGGTFLNSSDMTLNTNASLQLDTRLNIWNQYKTREEAYEAKKRELKFELMRRLTRVDQLMRSCKEFETWKSFMQKTVAHEAGFVPETGAEYLEQRKRNIEMRADVLDKEKKKVEGEAALISEYGLFAK